MDLFDELEMPVGVITNTANYEHCPEVLAAHRRRGDEFISHGRSQAERPIEMSLEAEREMVREVTERMTRYNGVKPTGWMTPYLTPSLNTTDLIAEAGYSYQMDWGICDEQPFWVKSRFGPVLALPYPIELNDQPAVVYRRNTAAEYAEMLVDNFDELLMRSRDMPLVFAISIHTKLRTNGFGFAQDERLSEAILATSALCAGSSDSARRRGRRRTIASNAGYASHSSFMSFSGRSSPALRAISRISSRVEGLSEASVCVASDFLMNDFTGRVRLSGAARASR